MIFREKDNFVILRFSDKELFPGERIFEVINSLNSSSYSILNVLGMARNVQIGFFEEETGYIKHMIPGPVEVLNLQGFFHKNTIPQFHIHALLGDRDSKTKGGHLFEMEVCNTLEVLLVKLPFDLRRKKKGKLNILTF